MNYIIGYFRNIGFSEMQVGIYGSFIGIASFLNFAGLWLAEKLGDIKRTGLVLCISSVILCFLGVLIGYLVKTAMVSIAVLVLMFLFQLGWYMGIPVQLYWQYRVVENKNWQKYFSIKMIFGDTAAMVTSMAVGTYLGKAPGSQKFIAVFAIAALVGILGCYFLYSTRSISSREDSFSFDEFSRLILKLLKQPASRNLLILILLRIFAYGMIIPFQPVFLLETIKLDYAEISLMVMLGTVFSIISYRPWAKLQDKYGNLRCLKWNLIACVIEPLIWLAANERNSYILYISYIVFGFSGMQGIVNAGYFTSCLGAIVEHPEEKLKSVYMSMYFVVYGVATMFAPLCGGMILRSFSSSATGIQFITDGYRILFFIAAFLLFLTAFLGTRFLKRTPVGSD